MKKGTNITKAGRDTDITVTKLQKVWWTFATRVPTTSQLTGCC